MITPLIRKMRQSRQDLPGRFSAGVIAVLTCLLATTVSEAQAQTPGLRGRSFSPSQTNNSGTMSYRMRPQPAGSSYSIHELLPLRDRRLRDFAWHYIDSPRPRKIMVHDIITITVDEKSQVTLRSGFDRQRTANLKAEIKEFLRIGERNRLSTAASNQPTIDTNLTGRLQSTGRVTNQEGIQYRIAATVVDVLPNGNVVLEARKSIRTDNDVWQFSLTGIISSANITRDSTALSEHIANLKIVKKRNGKVFDSTKRPWGVWLYDLLFPF
ncbi:MAG: hypothetical protein Tsb009_25970 [Planctomycetaceae bacterium]